MAHLAGARVYSVHAMTPEPADLLVLEGRIERAGLARLPPPLAGTGRYDVGAGGRRPAVPVAFAGPVGGARRRGRPPLSHHAGLSRTRWAAFAPDQQVL